MMNDLEKDRASEHLGQMIQDSKSMLVLLPMSHPTEETKRKSLDAIKENIRMVKEIQTLINLDEKLIPFNRLGSTH
jgi:hypothetical protein